MSCACGRGARGLFSATTEPAALPDKALGRTKVFVVHVSFSIRNKPPRKYQRGGRPGRLAEGAHPAGGCNRTGHLGAGLHTGDTCYARCADDYRVNATNGSLVLNCSDDVLYPPNFTCIAVGPVVGVVEGCTVADPPDHAHPLGGCTSANGTWCENGAATKPTRCLFF